MCFAYSQPMKPKSLAKLRVLSDDELEKIAAMIRDCAHCGRPFFASRAGALHCSPLCRLHSHRHGKTKRERRSGREMAASGKPTRKRPRGGAA